MVSDDRLIQMSKLLSTMSDGPHAPSDGLGVYLGDGIPRPLMGRLRGLELRDALEELLDLRKFARSQDRCFD